MTKQELPQKYRLEDVKPHLYNVYLQARQDAVKDIRASKEYLAKVEAFADTDRFNELTEKKEDTTAQVDEYLDFIQTMVDKILESEPKSSLFSAIYSSLSSRGPHRMYNINWIVENTLNEYDEKDMTPETWKEFVSKKYVVLLEEQIEQEQQNYADREMKLNVTDYWIGQKATQQFDALIAILPICSSMEKMENFVKEGLDYTKIVINS